MELKDKLANILPGWRERVRKLVKESGDVKVGDVTISQVYGGMRDVKGLVTDISYVDPNEGIRFRGYTIPEVLEKLPKPQGTTMPYAGGLYYLLLIGEIPTRDQALEVEIEWKTRANVPQFVFDVINAIPASAHPMLLFSTAILALQNESLFTKQYHQGMRKDEYWVPMLEDSLDLTARLPVIAAYIYNLKYRNGQMMLSDPNLDWAGNFAHMIGISTAEYMDLCRLYFILHSDHESGNASAHATHLAASTLSDIYYAFSAGINSLAGPVIPGYGHAVLRKPDPRFTAQFEYANKVMPDDEIFQIAKLVYEVVPQVLIEQGKAKNPSPNVDAISGTLQYHYGVKEFDFYTVMFGVGRSLGVSANAVWARALGQPRSEERRVGKECRSRWSP